MTTVHISGIKRHVSNGTTYYYLRASGEAITDEQGNRLDPNKQPQEPAEDGKVKLGLNIHGLRHSLGNELYDLGIEREARKRMLAHESDAASLRL